MRVAASLRLGAMPHSTGLRGRELIKGHATLNDFLMLVDPGCEVAISGADIAVHSSCDRHHVNTFP